MSCKPAWSRSHLQHCSQSCAHAGVELVSEDEEESEGMDGEQENVIPANEEAAACAAEEVMQEMNYQPEMLSL